MSLTFPWTTISGSSGPSITLGSAVSTLPDGGAIAGGYFEGQDVDLGDGTPRTSAQGGASQSSIVQRLRGDGSVAWTVASGSSGASTAQVIGVSALPDGTSVTSGTFLGTGVDLGDGVARTSAQAGGAISSFAQRLRSDGTVAWIVASTSTAPSTASADGVAATPDGGAIVTGSFSGTDVDLGDGVARTSAQGGAQLSSFTQAIHPDGTTAWVLASSAPPSAVAGNTMANAISPLPGGGVVITGRFSGVGVDLGDGIPRTSSGAGASYTGFTQVIRGNGSVAWTATSRDDVCPTGCGVDGTGVGAIPGGGAIVTGGFAGTDVDFGDGVLRSSASGGTSASAFTQRFRSDGSTAWVRISGGATAGFTKGISAAGLDDDGAIVTGYFQGSGIDLGDGVARTSPVSGTADAAFTQRIHPDGVVAWTLPSSAPGSSDVNGYGVDATPDGGIVAVGYFSGVRVDLGDGVARTSAESGSSLSRYAQKIVDIPQAPAAPRASAGDRTATVSVDALAGGAITAYGIVASPGGASCTITPPATGCTVTGLTNGTAYAFTARATNPAGTGPASPTSAAVTPSAPALSATVRPGRTRIRSGASMRVAINARNAGTATARSVIACATMPAGLAITSRGAARRSGRTACFTIPSIAPGARASRFVAVRATATRRVTRAVTGTVRADGLPKGAARPVRVTLLPAIPRVQVAG